MEKVLVFDGNGVTPSGSVELAIEAAGSADTQVLASRNPSIFTEEPNSFKFCLSYI